MINKLIIDNKNKDTYKLIMKVSTDDGEYLIYTKNELNNIGDIICYVGKYELADGVQKILPIESCDVLENLDGIFRQIIMLLNKKESSD